MSAFDKKSVLLFQGLKTQQVFDTLNPIHVFSHEIFFGENCFGYNLL